MEKTTKADFVRFFKANAIPLVVRDVVYHDGDDEDRIHLVGGSHMENGHYYVFTESMTSYLVPDDQVDKYGHVVLEHVCKDLEKGRLIAVNLRGKRTG